MVDVKIMEPTFWILDVEITGSLRGGIGAV